MSNTSWVGMRKKGKPQVSRNYLRLVLKTDSQELHLTICTDRKLLCLVLSLRSFLSFLTEEESCVEEDFSSWEPSFWGFPLRLFLERLGLLTTTNEY